MHAAVAPTRSQTIGIYTSPEEVRPVTVLQAHLTAGSGNATIKGSGYERYLDHPGNDVIHGGSSGIDYLYGGTGLDEIYGGSGTNYIYGNGEHDVLTGGSGSNYIQPNANGGGLASIQVKDDDYQPTYDGTIDQNGHATSGDSQAVDPGYGGGGCWKFDDFDSGARLGEDTVTPVAVYVTWNNSVSLDGGSRWAHSAVYSVYDVPPGGTPDSGNLVGSMTVNQQGSPLNQSPEPNDRPWTRLGVWNVNAGDTLTVELSDPSPAAGDRLCVGDAMIHPLWPTVDIQQTGVTVPTQVPATASAASDYADWFDACNPANIPVEGGGSRTEFVLTATVDPLFAQAPPYSGAAWNWTAKMPAVSGLEYWSASQSGSAWQPQPIAPGSTYTSDVWASTNPSATLPTGAFPITFKLCAPPGPGDADVEDEAPTKAVGEIRLYRDPAAYTLPLLEKVSPDIWAEVTLQSGDVIEVRSNLTRQLADWYLKQTISLLKRVATESWEEVLEEIGLSKLTELAKDAKSFVDQAKLALSPTETKFVITKIEIKARVTVRYDAQLLVPVSGYWVWSKWQTRATTPSDTFTLATWESPPNLPIMPLSMDGAAQLVTVAEGMARDAAGQLRGLLASAQQGLLKELKDKQHYLVLWWPATLPVDN